MEVSCSIVNVHGSSLFTDENNALSNNVNFLIQTETEKKTDISIPSCCCV